MMKRRIIKETQKKENQKKENKKKENKKKENKKKENKTLKGVLFFLLQYYNNGVVKLEKNNHFRYERSN